jgi:hypothetical protein
VAAAATATATARSQRFFVIRISKCFFFASFFYSDSPKGGPLGVEKGGLLGVVSPNSAVDLVSMLPDSSGGRSLRVAVVPAAGRTDP